MGLVSTVDKLWVQNEIAHSAPLSFQVMPPWFPRADGTFLKEPVRDAVRAGRIAAVPFMVG